MINLGFTFSQCFGNGTFCPDRTFVPESGSGQNPDPLNNVAEPERSREKMGGSSSTAQASALTLFLKKRKKEKF